MESADLASQALAAYADHPTLPRADFPTFTVDVWAAGGQLIETIAWTGNAVVSMAAWEAAAQQRARYEVTLRQGIRVVRKHQPAGG